MTSGIGVAFSEPPASAAWRLDDPRQGFESVFLRSDRSGCRIEGHTAAVDDGNVWVVRYVIGLDEKWTTRTARAWGRSLDGESEVCLDVDDDGSRQVYDYRCPGLDFECRLVYDEAGLILEHPGIATRVA